MSEQPPRPFVVAAIRLAQHVAEARRARAADEQRERQRTMRVVTPDRTEAA